jgi:hypothetical protein
MIHSVRLDRLPDGLPFPPELMSRISYSAERRELQFDGFMSKTDFDKLVRLNNDLGYQRALERLFQVCTFPVAKTTQSSHRKPYLLTGLAAMALALTVIVAAAMWWK